MVLPATGATDNNLHASKPFQECQPFKQAASHRTSVKSGAEVASVLEKDGGVQHTVCFLFSGNHLAEHLEGG